MRCFDKDFWSGIWRGHERILTNPEDVARKHDLNVRCRWPSSRSRGSIIGTQSHVLDVCVLYPMYARSHTITVTLICNQRCSWEQAYSMKADQQGSEWSSLRLIRDQRHDGLQQRVCSSISDRSCHGSLMLVLMLLTQPSQTKSIRVSNSLSASPVLAPSRLLILACCRDHTGLILSIYKHLAWVVIEITRDYTCF